MMLLSLIPEGYIVFIRYFKKERLVSVQFGPKF
jgi:hypothetical protein